MMILRLSLLVTLLAYSVQAVVVQRSEGFDKYGPPRPAAQYGPPQHVPHREYGVPQKIPFREYGPPALKYGPPKLNFIGGGGGSSSGFNGGIHEQVKSHFGVPKPFYGPPHIQHKQYGPPPPPRPQPQYGPPPKPIYGPPPQSHRPAPSYGPPPPPRPSYGPPPQSLPSPHPAPIFKPHHQPATSYGPPPSGPLNLPPKPVYGTPIPNYGPPPLPLNLPGPQPASFNHVPETTIILTSSSGHGGSGSGSFGSHGGSGNFGSHGGSGSFASHGGSGGFGGHNGGVPVKQVQIQIDSSGHTHSVSGSQAPFHTACDGWKPIPAPVGAFVENNHIDTQSGYSHVSQGGGGGGGGGGGSFGTQYSIGAGTGFDSGPATHGGGSFIDGLTDEQLVAVALQSDNYNGHSSIQLQTQQGPSLPSTGPSASHGLNSIESEALQLAIGSIADSYARPPSDSFAPGSGHAHKYNTINAGQSNFGLTPPSGSHGPSPLPPAAAFPNEQHFQSHSHSSASAGLGIQYGTQSGNVHPFPPAGGIQPNRPVAFRPPVPQGLLESIGATVQHVDQFGIRPPVQPPTYIPPAANEIAQTGPGNLGPEYGAPSPPTIILEQQLPIQEPPQSNYVPPVQEPRGNILNQYGPPPPENLPQQNYLPPQQQNQQYLPPPPTGFQQTGADGSFEHSFSASQRNQQFIHTQGLPQQQEARFNQVHDCGQGPNLVGAGYQFQQQQFGGTGSSSGSAYNAISQSIPVGERHMQFVSGPANSYGPPPSGNDIDHDGYASQKSAVATLPDGTNPQNLPGLDGLNVISAQKSESIQLSPAGANAQQQSSQTKYQLDFGGSSGSPLNGEQSANHEEILSQGLLQSILTAIEQPQSNQQTLHSYANHNAQSRSDTDVQEHATAESEEEPALDTSSKVDAKAAAASEEEATVREIKAIVPEEVDEDAGAEDEKEDKH